MPPESDRELLRRYVRLTDHEAFAELVRRYIAFVHAAAVRQTQDATLADDVTQAVMIVLARKAGTISSDAILASWLFTVTRHAAQNAMKVQSRQRFHERSAAAERSERVDPPDVSNADLRDVLDEAIARLPQLERAGVLLHYFHHRSHDEVGTALGLSTDAARKRVTRALAKMRTFLSGRGVVVSSAALVAGMHAEASSTGVSAGLVSSTVNVALLSGSSAAQVSGSGSIAIAHAHAVTRMLTLAKLKVAATIAVAIVGVSAATALPLAGLASRAITKISTTTLLASSEPSTQPASRLFTTDVAPGVQVDFLGVSSYPPDEQSWFSIAGEPIDVPEPRLLESRVQTTRPPEHQLALRVRMPKGAVTVMDIENASLASHSHMDVDGDYILLSSFALQDPAETVSIRLGIATSDWKTIAAADGFADPVDTDAGEYGVITLMPPEKDNLVGGTKVEVHHRTIKLPYHLIVTDASGKEHVSHNVNVNRTNDDCVSSYTFELPQDQIKKAEFQIREFDKFVEASEISLSSGRKTTPRIRVTDADPRR